MTWYQHLIRAQSLLKQGLSEPECYGDLVHKFKKIVGRNDVPDQFRKSSFVTVVIQKNLIQPECYATDCMLGS